MPIEGIQQPDVLAVSETIRLRRYDGVHDFALPWYQDAELIWLVDGVRESYDADKLSRMYRYLDAHGELYWIEQLRSGVFTPIGDVTFSAEDMPIVIGDAACRGVGIGSMVVRALIMRAKELGFPALHVREIYHWNEPSHQMFERIGFTACKKTEKGYSYILTLTKH